jgi:endoglucanase
MQMSHMMRARGLVAFGLLALVISVPAPAAALRAQRKGRPRHAHAASVAVSVRGNQLVDAHGHTLRLVGVNRSGSQYMCVLGRGIFDGPVDAASIAAMKAWHINSARAPRSLDAR